MSIKDAATEDSNLIVVEAGYQLRASRTQLIRLGLRDIKKYPALFEICDSNSLNSIDPFAIRIFNYTAKDVNIPIMLAASGTLSSMIEARH